MGGATESMQAVDRKSSENIVWKGVLMLFLYTVVAWNNWIYTRYNHYDDVKWETAVCLFNSTSLLSNV